MVITRYKIVIVTKQTKEAEPPVICKENNKDIIYLPLHKTIHIIPVASLLSYNEWRDRIK